MNNLYFTTSHVEDHDEGDFTDLEFYVLARDEEIARKVVQKQARRILRDWAEGVKYTDLDAQEDLIFNAMFAKVDGSDGIINGHSDEVPYSMEEGEREETMKCKNLIKEIQKEERIKKAFAENDKKQIKFSFYDECLNDRQNSK